MSGGHFSYNQNRIEYIIEAIDELIRDNDRTDKDEWGDTVGNQYKPETIKRFKEAVVLLRLAQVYAQRIDWLVSCDDGEESFHKRLEEELNELQAPLHSRT